MMIPPVYDLSDFFAHKAYKPEHKKRAQRGFFPLLSKKVKASLRQGQIHF
jgi:hypothetical protein